MHKTRLTGFETIGVAVAVLLLSVAVIACSGGGSRVAASQDPGILLVVVDALRRDKLGCYGYERELTPAIDALASDPDAVVFQKHYANGAQTKISTASLFTGLFPFQHGVIWDHQMKQKPSRAGVYATQILSDEFETRVEPVWSRWPRRRRHCRGAAPSSGAAVCIDKGVSANGEDTNMSKYRSDGGLDRVQLG